MSLPAEIEQQLIEEVVEAIRERDGDMVTELLKVLAGNSDMTWAEVEARIMLASGEEIIH